MNSFKIPKFLRQYNLLFEKKPIAVLSTLMPNGYPQQSLVWFDFKGDLIRINTVAGRQKDLNMQRHPMVSLLILDPDNYTVYLELRGKVVKRTLKDAKRHLDELTKRYMSLETFPYKEEAKNRIIYEIEIMKFRASTELQKQVK